MAIVVCATGKNAEDGNTNCTKDRYIHDDSHGADLNYIHEVKNVAQTPRLSGIYGLLENDWRGIGWVQTLRNESQQQHVGLGFRV